MKLKESNSVNVIINSYWILATVWVFNGESLGGSIRNWRERAASELIMRQYSLVCKGSDSALDSGCESHLTTLCGQVT